MDAKLKAANEALNPKKPKSEKENLEESAQAYKERNSTVPEIVARWKADNAIKFKDNPVELAKANLLADRWALNHLDD